MKTNVEHVACLLLLLTALASCGKEDAATPVEESPFFTFFDHPAITIDTTSVAATTWEYGFVFNPLADGKITKLGVKMPASGQFHVTLWDLSGTTPTILSEQNVTAAIHFPTFADITAVGVQKNATLGITVRANAFYRVQKQNATAFSFPLQVDNIRIVSFNEEQNPASAVFPPMTNSNRVAPCVNVVFVAD